ncbi:hypothetical protein WJX84_001592 [Apatococcus fuscideae]|uniref:G-patch domain-containing protein n=1 Tax=Apatococcus fuscideae TaxID=2026836 RepID=A0AAW1SWC9_9CHLO
MPRSKRSVSAAAAIKSFSRFFDGTGSGLSRNLPTAGFGDKDACSCAQCRRRSGPVTADTSMAVEEIYGLFADSDPDGGLVGAAEDATDEEIQAKHKQLAEAAVSAVERGDDERLRKVLDSVESDEELQADLASVLVIPVAQYGHSHLVGLLTDYGADLAETDPSRGGPPLMHAANNGHAGTVTALLRCGADPEGIDYNSQTALMVAIFSDRASAAEALLEGGAVVDTEDEKGRTALSHAAKYGSIDCLHILAQHNADVFHEDHDGRTPLEIADECGRAEAVLQLRRLQQRQKLRERREQRAKAAEDDRRNGLSEAERAAREAKAAKNMEALLQELDADAARAAAKQDTRRARRKAARLRGCHSELSNGHSENGHHPLSPSSSASDVTATGLTGFPPDHNGPHPPTHRNGFTHGEGNEVRQHWDELLSRGNGCRDEKDQQELIGAIKTAMPAIMEAGMSVKYGKKVLGKLERAVEVRQQLQPSRLESMPLQELQDAVNKSKGVRGLLDPSMLDDAEAVLGQTSSGHPPTASLQAQTAAYSRAAVSQKPAPQWGHSPAPQASTGTHASHPPPAPPSNGRDAQLLHGSSSPPASMFQNPWQPAMASMGLVDHFGLDGILPGLVGKAAALADGDHQNDSECIVCLAEPKQTCCTPCGHITMCRSGLVSARHQMDEAAFLEEALQEQLSQQKGALIEVETALEADEDDVELCEIKQQLQEAVQEAEAALLELKRDRLLRQLAAQETGPSPKQVGSFESEFCRFRYTDGRWYRGRVVSQSGETARVEFSHPTQAFMRGTQLDLPAACLQPAQPPQLLSLSLAAGTRVLAADSTSGLWLQAEFVAFGDDAVQVVLMETGEHQIVKPVDVILSAEVEASSPVKDTDSVSPSQHGAAAFDGSSSDDEEDGLGLQQEQAASLGAQTDTVHFSAWEAHTRGIGSKLMVQMGYRRDCGLGRTLAGSQAPLEVRLQKPGAGLGSDVGEIATGTGKAAGKKRGGERARKRKHADRARADRAEAWREADAAEAEAGVPSMFSFINNSLGGGSEAAALKRRQHGAFATRSEAPVELFPGHAPSGADPLAQNHANGASHRASSGEQPGGSKYFGASTGSKGGKPKGSQHDGRALLAQQEHVAGLLQKVARLQQMGARNAGDRVISSQVGYKLKQAQAQLAAAEAAAASSSQAVHAKDAQKKWLKF